MSFFLVRTIYEIFKKPESQKFKRQSNEKKHNRDYKALNDKNIRI